MKGGLGNLMKQAQQMQEAQKKMQEELAAKEITGTAGGGLVSIVMNGRHDVKRVNIDDSVMDDKEMLEDLIAAAVNDAVRTIEKQSQEALSGMLGGLKLPPGFKMPF